MSNTPHSSSVLVIDDEPVIVTALVRVLTAAGMQVATAEDAETALYTLPRADPAVVVVDLKLPGMSGIDFIPEARAIDPGLVVILMSGYASHDHVVASFSAGAFTFLEKPFTQGEALSAVARALRYHGLKSVDRVPCAQLPDDVLLGVQSWARHEPGGVVLAGGTDVFIRTMGRPVDVEFPALDYPLASGDVLARVQAADGSIHRIWGAVGGQVIELNDRLRPDPDLLARDPTGAGWIVRLQSPS